jgi:hypothetical protein
MSHFSSIQTKIIDRDCLVAGLQQVLGAIGIVPVIELHEQPTLLENSYAPSDRAYAHVIVRRACIPRPGWREGVAAIDIGFLKGQDDSYSAILDEWDITYNAIGAHFQGDALGQFMAAVTTQHNIAYVKAQYPQANWDYGDMVQTADGMQMTLTQKPRAIDLAMA